MDLDGVVHRPGADEDRVLVIYLFVSIDCPIANFYQPTLRKLEQKFSAKGVHFFQVHCDPDLALGDAKKHAADFDVTAPVILDPRQQLARHYKATTTPEAIAVDRAGKVVYRGRIDDTYSTYGKRRPEPTSRDLQDAIEATLAGRKIEIAVTKPVGCKIFFEEPSS